MRCQCNFEDSFITNAGFQCFPASPNAVTFRARISGSQQVTASEIIRHLEEWTASGAFISVQAQLLSADSSCAVRISSFGDQECQSTSEDPAGSGNTTVIIGAVVAVIVVLVSLVVTSVVIFMLLRNRKTVKLQGALEPAP